MNYLHKFHLVEAEARVLGQFFEAEEFYEQTIQGAEITNISEEALAYELAELSFI